MKNMLKKHTFYIILIAMGYFVAARLGLLLAFPGTNATPLWAPTGISLAAVLLLGYRVWPGIALGALAVNFVLLGELSMSLPVSLAASLCTSVGNTLEALIGAFLIRRFTKSENPFDRTADVVKFIIFGAVISTIISAAIGVTTFCLSSGVWKDFGSIWLTWWLGDVMGAVLIVPLAMTYKKSVLFKLASRPEAWKNILMLACLFAVWHIVFSQCCPVPFLMLPILIFSAFYQGQFGSAAMICILSGLSTFSTVNHMGPFGGYTLNESLLLQQGFIGTVAITTMILASLVEERKKSKEILREIYQKYRRLTENARDMIYCMSLPDGRYEYVSPASTTLFGYFPEEFYDSDLLIQKIIHPDWHGYFKEQWENLIAGKMPPFYEYQIIHKSGEVKWLHQRNVLIKDNEGRHVAIEGIVTDITERKKAEEEIKTINGELIAINRIIKSITGVLSINEILENVLDEALGITGLEGGTICMVTPQHTLQLAAHRATSEETILDLTTNEIKVGDCLCGECARDHKPLILRDREAILKFATREATRGEDIRFHAAFPLIFGGKCLGVLCVFTRTDKKPEERRLKLLETVTSQIALAVQNAGLFEETLRNAAVLEERVKDRTAELEDKTAKLERLNRLFVGRELRMKELKERVRELEKKFGVEGLE